MCYFYLSAEEVRKLKARVAALEESKLSYMTENAILQYKQGLGTSAAESQHGLNDYIWMAVKGRLDEEKKNGKKGKCS